MAVATAVTSRMKMVATVPMSEPEPRWSDGLGRQVPGSETGTVQFGPRRHGEYIKWIDLCTDTVQLSEPPRWFEGLARCTGTVQFGPRHNGECIIWRHLRHRHGADVGGR